jgi:hypothetical protein
MTEVHGRGFQKQFDFPPPRLRPFLTNLPARIDTYEEGVARFFQWRTGLDYYATIDQIIDFVINTRRIKVRSGWRDGKLSWGGSILSTTTSLCLNAAGRERVT